MSSNNFQVWYDPKKYTSYTMNEKDTFEENNDNNIQFDYNRYNDNDYKHSNVGTFGISTPPPIITSKNEQHSNYFQPNSYDSQPRINSYTNGNNDRHNNGNIPSLNNPFFSPLAQMGINEAQKIVSNVQENYAKNWFGPLRYYFTVNNRYVFKKIGILMFPFLHRCWSRKVIKGANGDTYSPPNDDINAPDLYIPIMAFITYILMLCGIMGQSEKGFQPDHLSVTATTGIITLFIEVMIVKLLFYLFLSENDSPSISILDALAYCGYKFVSLSMTLLLSTISNYLFYGSFILFYLFTAWFLIKSLSPLIPTTGGKMTRNYVILAIIILDGIFSFFLCLTL